MTAPTIAPATALVDRMRFRTAFQASPDGRTVTCLTAPYGEERLALEVRRLPGGRWRLLSDDETAYTRAVPVAGDQIAVLRGAPGDYRLHLLSPAADRHVRTLDWTSAKLLAAPPRQVLAYAVVFDDALVRSHLFLVLPHEPWVSHVATVEGMLAGGFPLDTAGRRLGMTHLTGDTARPVAVDTLGGDVTPLPGASAQAREHLLLASPVSGRLVLASDAPGHFGVACATPGGDVTFPAGLNAIDGTVAPIAIDPTGERLALRVQQGATSRLLGYHVDTDRAESLTTPVGIINREAVWNPAGLYVSVSTPTIPGELVRAGDPATPRPTPWVPGRAVWLTGAGEPMEAVVYGDDWRHARHLLIALHGGPEAHWRLEFEPQFQWFAQAGIAVVAPNQRGSTGYGEPYRARIDGAWGGADLDDVHALARDLAEARAGAGLPPPMLYGASYGAFLALLAAATAPELFGRVAVVAPFLSGQRLHRQASHPTRRLVARLGGDHVHVDALGPRDLGDLHRRLAVPLHIIHGTGDQVVPVEQSRELVGLLRRAGRSDDLDYVEVPGGGHFPIGEPGGAALADAMIRFLLRDPA
ncbi:alpha/beta fold hydrolase [Sphaerisporangium sp. NBC_01403]|uniref:S9 family peptidase n=1 Tax=Sphaerisporangium sp. NBC_01403 TaxID=2903599 RepID=UPI003245808E